MLGIPTSIALGFLSANLTEWLFHKYVLHGLGKNKDSIWNFHWHEHHKESRKNNMVDKDYLKPFHENFFSKETLALVGGGAILIPVLKAFPWFVGTMWTCGIFYFVVHRLAHKDETWALKYVPWHRDHHMLTNQSHNWNVTLPVWDYILGTRVTSSSPVITT